MKLMSEIFIATYDELASTVCRAEVLLASNNEIYRHNEVAMHSSVRFVVLYLFLHLRMNE